MAKGGSIAFVLLCMDSQWWVVDVKKFVDGVWTVVHDASFVDQGTLTHRGVSMEDGGKLTSPAALQELEMKLLTYHNFRKDAFVPSSQVKDDRQPEFFFHWR